MFFNEMILFPTGGPSHFRIPSLVVTNDGTVLAFCNDRRATVEDHATESVMMYTRKLPGQPWESIKELDQIDGWACSMGAAVYDPATDIVMCFGKRELARPEWHYYTDEELKEWEEKEIRLAKEGGFRRGWSMFTSADQGATWQDEALNLLPRPFTPEGREEMMITGYTHGCGAGIRLRHGKHPGRLLCPTRIITGEYANFAEASLVCYNNSMYSDDHGKTWHASAPVQQGTGEGTLIEDENGVIHYNSRGMHCDQKRYLATSYDCGETYQDFRTDDFLIEEKEIGCNAAFFRVEKEDLPGLPQGVSSITLFSNPRDEIREKMSICYSFDNGKTWAGVKQVWEKGAAYSSLAYDKKSGHFFLLYERGPNGQAFHPYDDGISIAEFDLEWLLGQQN
ncbi:MAG: exo-alpha-sialidase [Clostridiales bacterium]|nr:exo-alpha-sialidase [Clostridiales bacterium]